MIIYYCFNMEQYDVNISDTIRVLAVAPYNEMAQLIAHEAENYPELKLEAVTGDLQQGVKKAQADFHNDYDILLSRGGTAQLLREQTDLPVVDIPIGFLDILKAVQLSANAGVNRAVVGFENITANIQVLNDLLNLDLDIYTLTSEEDMDEIIAQLQKKQYDAVLCDVVASNHVQQAGLNAILIASGPASIDRALEDVILTAHNMKQLRLENHFLRSVLREHSGETIVFNDKDDLYFSSLKEDDPDVIALLKGLIPEVKNGTARHVWKSMKGILYSIKSAAIEIEGIDYIAFFFTTSRSGAANKNAGITYLTYTESKQRYESSLFRLSGEAEQFKDRLEAFTRFRHPLLISGEYGTGRTAVADYFYINSPFRRKSLIEIDCSMLNEKSCDFLYNSLRSPFYANGCTIHIMNMDQCSEERLNELINYLNFMPVCENNLVIFSGDTQRQPLASQEKYLKDKFQCLTVQLKPLRESSDQIPAISSACLSTMKNKEGGLAYRLDRHAMVALKTYEWPGNYIQFQRVLVQACAMSQDNLIHDTAIRALLAQERNTSVSMPAAESMNLERPLAEIEKDIVMQVLRDNNGNQAAAAKQLQIGRTTLWRLLNREK